MHQAILSAAAALAFVYDPTPYLVGGPLPGGPPGPNRTAAEAEEIFRELRTASHSRAAAGVVITA